MWRVGGERGGESKGGGGAAVRTRSDLKVRGGGVLSERMRGSARAARAVSLRVKERGECFSCGS